MALEFNITEVCPVCGGDGIRTVWQGAVDEEGNFVPPGDAPCLECNETGERIIGTITIPQLDNLITKVDAIAAQVQVLFDDLNQ